MQLEGGYAPLPSMPEEEPPDTEQLLGSENFGWDAVPNLDQFFTRLYRYWESKGFAVLLLSRILNLAALGFTVFMSALLLLYVNWGALQAECLKKDTCDIMEVAIRRHPLQDGLTPGTFLACLYLAAFSAYWLVALASVLLEMRGLVEIRHFCNHKLGISERQLGTMTWPEVAHRLVQVQRVTRLCLVRDLSEHDVVSRIMRKENYLIAMLNRGVLALNLPLPGLRRHLLLTKTMEWNLYWCVLDALFDDHFRLRRAFLQDEHALKRRFRILAALNLAASPFMLLFLLIYFFMKNAEKFYHHPSSVGARRWSPLAKWRLREFNELPHFITHRLNASHEAAERYIQQFPNHILSHVARFVAFVSGSFAALLLVLALIDEKLLERDLLGRQIVWWVATVGMLLALSRAFIIESCTAFDPEIALWEVVAHTHYLPRHWRGRAHTLEVQEQFEALFQYKAVLLLEELASTLLTPFVLYFSLPSCAGTILRFVEEHSVHVEGVGDVCSLAAFDFARHGNAKYGAAAEVPKWVRSRQGKMEKSFLSFAAAYPQWEPQAGGQRLFLSQLAATQAHLNQAGQRTAGAAGGVGASGALGWSGFAGGGLGQAAGGGDSGGVAAAGSWLGRYLHNDPPPQPSGIFASAELEDAAVAGAAAWGVSPRAPFRDQPQCPPWGGAGGAAERVAYSQMLLQSMYQEREQQGTGQQGRPPHHAPPPHPSPKAQLNGTASPTAHLSPAFGPPPQKTWSRHVGSTPAGGDRQLSNELSVLSRTVSREEHPAPSPPNAEGSLHVPQPGPGGAATENLAGAEGEGEGQQVQSGSPPHAPHTTALSSQPGRGLEPLHGYRSTTAVSGPEGSLHMPQPGPGGAATENLAGAEGEGEGQQVQPGSPPHAPHTTALSSQPGRGLEPLHGYRSTTAVSGPEGSGCRGDGPGPLPLLQPSPQLPLEESRGDGGGGGGKGSWSSSQGSLRRSWHPSSPPSPHTVAPAGGHAREEDDQGGRVSPDLPDFFM